MLLKVKVAKNVYYLTIPFLIIGSDFKILFVMAIMI